MFGFDSAGHNHGRKMQYVMDKTTLEAAVNVVVLDPDTFWKLEQYQLVYKQKTGSGRSMKT